MKRNFDEPILNLDGEPVRLGASAETLACVINAIWPKLTVELQKDVQAALDKEAGKPLTLGSACIGALLTVYQGEENLDDSARLTRAELARRIHKGGVIDIEPKERDLVKPLLRKKYAGSILVPVVAGELLEKDAAEPLKSVA